MNHIIGGAETCPQVVRRGKFVLTFLDVTRRLWVGWQTRRPPTPPPTPPGAAEDMGYLSPKEPAGLEVPPPPIATETLQRAFKEEIDEGRAVAFCKRLESTGAAANEHDEYMQVLRSCSFATVPRCDHRPRDQRLRDLEREASREREALSRPRQPRAKPTQMSPFTKPAREGVRNRSSAESKALASQIAHQGISGLPVAEDQMGSITQTVRTLNRARDIFLSIAGEDAGSRSRVQAAAGASKAPPLRSSQANHRATYPRLGKVGADSQPKTTPTPSISMPELVAPRAKHGAARKPQHQQDGGAGGRQRVTLVEQVRPGHVCLDACTST